MNVLKIGRVYLGVASLCLLSACGSSSFTNEEVTAAADSVAYAYDPATSKLPEERLLIRKAEMNFKVKELQKVSQQISTLTSRYGGEVWNSRLETDIQNSITNPISSDSLLEVTLYRQTNALTLRVPSKNLDSLLNEIEQLSLLLHKKEINTENVSLAYLSNELKAKNGSRTENRYEKASEKKTSTLEEYAASEYLNTERQNDVIDRQIENLGMMDKVNFSTVTISIYQDTEAYKNVVANLDHSKFEAGFGASSIMALQDGWEFMVSSILFLIRIWPLYLFGIGLFFLIRFIDKFRPKMVIEK